MKRCTSMLKSSNYVAMSLRAAGRFGSWKICIKKNTHLIMILWPSVTTLSLVQLE